MLHCYTLCKLHSKNKHYAMHILHEMWYGKVYTSGCLQQKNNIIIISLKWAKDNARTTVDFYNLLANWRPRITFNQYSKSSVLSTLVHSNGTRIWMQRGGAPQKFIKFFLCVKIKYFGALWHYFE